jgi:hypothetical protein
MVAFVAHVFVERLVEPVERQLAGAGAVRLIGSSTRNL